MPRVKKEEPVFCHIALAGGVPFGKIQCYRNLDYPEYAQQISTWDGISFDLFIGEPAFIGKGYGRAMLRSYIDLAFDTFPDEAACYITHETRNEAALRCSRSVGFVYQKTVYDENQRECHLLKLDRRST